jgi:hypothetical protein
MPTFPKECIYSGIPQYDRMELDCWALMLKPEIDGCPHNVYGMDMTKFFFETSNTLCDNEKVELCSYCKIVNDYRLVTKGCKIHLGSNCANQNWLLDFSDSQCHCDENIFAQVTTTGDEAEPSVAPDSASSPVVVTCANIFSSQ